MLDKTLLFKAADAAQGIAAAQTAIEDRKRAVDEAKAAVEVAKADLVEAKSAYDAVIAEFVASGVPASKVKRNVEDFLRILGDLGYVENSGEEAPASAEAKAPRRKKAEQAAPPADIVAGVARLAEAGEPGVIILAEQSESVQAESVAAGAVVAVAEGAEQDDDASSEPAVEQAVAIEDAPEAVEPPADEQNEVEEAGVDEPTVEADLPEASVDSVSYGIDNSEAFSEVLDLIETIASADREEVSETLVTLLNAADWFSREWEKEPLDVNFYRGILNLQFVESALQESMAEELRSALVVVREAPQSASIFEWFAASLDLLESGGKTVPFAEFSAKQATEQATTVDVVEDEPAAEPASTVSDDVALVGETVEDIGEINFLEDAASLFAGATVESTVVEAPKGDEQGARPVEQRSFRPRFLGSKG